MDEDSGKVEIYVGGEYNSRNRKEAVLNGSDTFAVDLEKMRGFDGLSTNFKKRITRGMSKLRENSDGSARSKHIETEAITGYVMFDVIVPPYNLEALAKLYHESTPHAAAVKAKVSNIVGLGYQFVESPKIRMKMEDMEDEDARSKLAAKIRRGRIAIEDLIDSMNKEDDFGQTLQKIWTDYEATGNGYMEIGRKANGEIGYIGHIPSSVLRVRKQRDGFIQILNDKVVFFRNFGEKTADPVGDDRRPNEIIHFKKYSPISTFYGVPDIIAAMSAVAGDEFASRFNLDYFENKAVPRYIIVSKGADLSAAAQRRLTEFFETSVKGKNHRTLYVPLPADQREEKVSFEMQPVEAGVQDSSFAGYHKTNVDIVLMAHRVPITKVSAGDGIALAAARDLDKTFKEQVCRPEQITAEKKINRVIQELTDMFLIKLNELSLTDEDTQSQIDERNVRNGIELPNEIRARKGQPAIKAGNLTPHEQEMAAQTQGEQHAEKLAKEAAAAQKAAAAAAPRPAATAPKKSTQRKADAKATAGQTRTRDSVRSAGATDSRGEGRNAKGAGRKTP